MLRGPTPSQPQGPTRMNKKPRLMRPLASGQYQYEGMRILPQWPASQANEERRVLTVSLHTVPDIHQLFNLHKCDWMARDPGTYSEEIVREFYASYAAPLHGSISKQSKPIAKDPLTSTVVRGCSVDISHANISRFLYGPTTGHSWSLNTAEFDYRWDIVRSGALQRNVKQREAVILWLGKYIAAKGERAEWVGTPRDSGVLILHCDKLTHPTRTLDIGLIRDEANVAAPRREPRVKVPPLGADPVDTMGQTHGSDPIMPDHTDTIPASSSQAASRASSSSRSTHH
ncbi:hypothetical protein H5410_056422 [Solanum commersonii]|uniref:Putative plant transposon protein domain-containing protein n=1 Tax=Solanum commersonii TaxID=4109 RepID=A0A9J5WMN0_SOLCO|nr:hypothetical protein H5410_056422 [Solanum commersonii]